MVDFRRRVADGGKDLPEEICCRRRADDEGNGLPEENPAQEKDPAEKRTCRGRPGGQHPLYGSIKNCPGQKLPGAGVATRSAATLVISDESCSETRHQGAFNQSDCLYGR